MAVEVIDLCSSPEPDESPTKQAEGILAGFQPRKDKVQPKLANGSSTNPVRNGYHSANGYPIHREPGTSSSSHLPQTGALKDDDGSYEKNSADRRFEESESLRNSNGNQLADKHVRPEQKTSRGHAQTEPHNSSAKANGEQARKVVDLENDESNASDVEINEFRFHKKADEAEPVRSFRIDKSKRYPQVNGVTKRSSARNSLGERDSISAIFSERIQDAEVNELPEANGLPGAASALPSGAGLEVVRVQQDIGQRYTSPKPENAVKRPTSSDEYQQEQLNVKRARTGGHNVTTRSRLVLIDVTNPDTERLSYSSEPDIPKFFPPLKTSPAAVSSKARRNQEPSQTADLKRPPKASRKRADFSKGPNMKGLEYTPEEDALLCELKDDGFSWNEIVTYFNGRTSGSLQVRYSNKLARRDVATSARPERRKSTLSRPELHRADSSDNMASGRGKRSRNIALSAVDGFVSWASLKGSRRESRAAVTKVVKSRSPAPSLPKHLLQQDHTYPSALSQILRRREIGLTSRRSWTASSPRGSREETKDHVYKDYTLQKQYHGTSGDVVALSWAPDGDRFAAGSIAISDNRSMQYNMQRNLLVGARQSGRLRELIDHHVPRPLIDDTDNVNGLHAMRASQDSRLFKTVTATAFAPGSSKKLYTTGEDMMLRSYSVGKDLHTVKLKCEIPHPARVDLLAVSSPHGIVATGCHVALGSISLYRFLDDGYETGSVFSPKRNDLLSDVPIFPSTLKWGIAPQHSTFLLAGFSGDEDKENAGETCLWNINTGDAIPLRTLTRNVLDVAWNPNPSSASVTFAVASCSTSLAVGRGTRSAIQCFAPDQQEARKVIIWECPAPDINDVLFCPYDENLIAAGATNGTVYIWDKRSASRSQDPLHVLEHGATENIIAHDRDPETADTGVRFLSWGATKNRLYSGSHDGILKVWNPYRSPDNAHVDDNPPPRNERSAVMSGAFNDDHRELLIGTENGRINLFSIEGVAVYRQRRFKLETAPLRKEEVQADALATARSLVDLGKIEIRPCGAMPFRQAVQGPNYNGPFLAPSDEETRKAETRYNEALTAQSDAHLRKAQSYIDDDSETIKADGEVVAAQQALDEIQERLNHFSFAQPKAAGFQQSLLKAENERSQLLSRLSRPVEACGLQCAVLPNSEEVEDSGRSELRIPEALRSIEHNAAISAVGDDHAIRDCSSCFPLNARRGQRIFCAACKLKKAGLTATCSRCSAPARLQIDTTKETLCERCCFTCFRCNGTIAIDDEMIVSCSSCQLTWEMGVLGYSLLTAPARHQKPAKIAVEELEQYDDFGDLEREHYASLWQDADVNDMMGY